MNLSRAQHHNTPIRCNPNGLGEPGARMQWRVYLASNTARRLARIRGAGSVKLFPLQVIRCSVFTQEVEFLVGVIPYVSSRRIILVENNVDECSIWRKGVMLAASGNEQILPGSCHS